jgi:hypothetical protein
VKKGEIMNRKDLIVWQRQSVAEEIDRMVSNAQREAEEAIERARSYAGFGTGASGTATGFASCARQS